MRFLMFLALIATLSALLVTPLPAQGQEETPTPTVTPTVTPTPAYIQEQQLSSGNTLRVERTITYGDAAVTIMLFVCWVTFLLVKAVEIPKRFMQR